MEVLKLELVCLIPGEFHRKHPNRIDFILDFPEILFLSHDLNFFFFFSKFANPWITILCVSCVTTVIWHLNANCTEWAHGEMIYTVWTTFLCFSSIGRSFRSSISLCLLSLMMSRQKLTACFALLHQLTFASSRGKSRPRKTPFWKVYCYGCFVSIPWFHNFHSECVDTGLRLRFYSDLLFFFPLVRLKMNAGILCTLFVLSDNATFGSCGNSFNSI